MFDDPKKHLKWMEEALLAEESEEVPEEPVEEPELDWEEILNEDWDPTQPPKSNPAIDFGSTCFADEEFDEDAAVLQPRGMAARKIAQTQKKEAQRQSKEAQKKQKGIAGLVVLALLELLGIFLILGWWITWLL